eukprot:COSAG03_NODE_10891_length_623_cov_1.469466_1_plen_56_part_01
MNIVAYPLLYAGQAAARYLVLAIAQIALGRLAARWAHEGDNAALHRREILEALRPW